MTKVLLARAFARIFWNWFDSVSDEELAPVLEQARKLRLSRTRRPAKSNGLGTAERWAKYREGAPEWTAAFRRALQHDKLTDRRAAEVLGIKAWSVQSYRLGRRTPWPHLRALVLAKLEAHAYRYGRPADAPPAPAPAA